MAQIADEGYIKMIEQQGRQGADPGDARLWVKFEHRPAPDPEATAQAGHPKFRSEEWIRIAVPGERDEVERPVTEFDKVRFSKQYDHWKASGAQAVEGYPLEKWPGVTRVQVEELKFFKINTVEDLANVPDALGSKFMGIQALKTQAKNFLAAAAGEAQVTKMQAELDKRDAEITALQRALKDQGDKLEQVLKAQRR
jgi:hypothetical protein